MEKYARLVAATPVERMHALAEADPDAAAAWAEREQALADAWAEAHGCQPDEKQKADIRRDLLERIGDGGAAQK